MAEYSVEMLRARLRGAENRVERLRQEFHDLCKDLGWALIIDEEEKHKPDHDRNAFLDKAREATRARKLTEGVAARKALIMAEQELDIRQREYHTARLVKGQ